MNLLKNIFCYIFNFLTNIYQNKLEKDQQRIKEAQNESVKIEKMAVRKDFERALNSLPGHLKPATHISGASIRTAYDFKTQNWFACILVSDTSLFTPFRSRRLQDALNDIFQNIVSDAISDFKERVLYDVNRYRYFLESSPTQTSTGTFLNRIYSEYMIFFSGNAYRLLQVELLGIYPSGATDLILTAHVNFDYFNRFSPNYFPQYFWNCVNQGI